MWQRILMFLIVATVAAFLVPVIIYSTPSR